MNSHSYRSLAASIPAVWSTLGDRLARIAPQSRPPAVLVVDDETPIRALVARILQPAGYEVVVAGSGAEAIERFKDMPYCDLLLTDLMMPEMNGDELARRLRAENPELKVLYLTGFSDKLFADKMQLWDGEAFLDKPCSMTGVLEGAALLLTGHLPAGIH